MYEELPWDDDIRSFRESRSRLFRLEFMRTEEGVPEGLRSYFLRLSREHMVSPRRLMKKVLADEVPELAPILSNRFFVKDAGPIDGLGKYARIFSETINQLTSRDDLQDLTLLKWAPVLPKNGEGILARYPRWCPICYLEQRIKGVSTFSPLSWSLRLYQTCTKHFVQLLERCPGCSRHQPFISSFPNIGRCGYCGRSLSDVVCADTLPVNVDVELALESMAQNAQSPAKVSLEYFCSNVRVAIAVHAQDNKALFCRQMGWDNWTANAWLSKGHKPSLPSLLALAIACGVDVFDLCSQNLEFCYRPATQCGARMRSRVCRAPRPFLRHTNWDEVFDLLTTELHHNSAKTVNELGRRVRLRRSALKYWFPEVCGQISERYRKQKKMTASIAIDYRRGVLESVLGSLAMHRVPPFRRVVDKFLKQHGLALARPELAKVYYQYLVAHGFVEPT
ncbi:hypothetical protein DXT88_20490 [Herbaspirillum lusitanum]|uniref:TniQ family protein n=1 Tax=Herbaspirillum lusitanum TaxID=213312 RepID=UPI002AA2A44A|nr:TniQ family protein [Herbaspirillum lusitanum]MCW5300553.1 hypothetical protein [Herbaspirillum lusitanum]